MRTTASLLFFLLAIAGPTAAQPLYNPDQITTIEITFSQSNWDQILKNYYAAGNDERLPATVEINGQAFDSVGVRYRGGITYDPANAKNPLNLKLDYAQNQDYDGFEVLKLGNGALDPSMMREVLTFELAQHYMVAPKANYAAVYVNGNYHGLYTNIESVNSAFFERNFLSNPDNARFECTPSYGFDDNPPVPPFGCTIGNGAALEYLGPGIACYFDHYSIQSPTGWEALRDMAQVLKNNPGNARQVLDLDRFIWMSALNSLLVNLDSYLGAGVRNYVIGEADNGRFVPILEDVNESFARFPWTSVPQAGEPQPPLAYYTALDPWLGVTDNTKPLLQAIFGNPTWRRMYTAHLRTMMKDFLPGGWFEQRVEALKGLIQAPLESDLNHFYTTDEFLQNLEGTVVDPYNGEDAYGLKPLMEGRISYLQSLPELQAQPPVIGNYGLSPENPQPGSNFSATVTVSGATAVWMGYRSNVKEMFQLVQLYDDGQHGDGAAGDGLYGASLVAGTGGNQFYFYAENSGAGIFSPERAEYEFYETGSSAEVAINELLAANGSTVADQSGEYDDWVELYNNTNATVNLAGWYLSDDPGLLTKWQFPNGVFIAPGEYLVVWTDGDAGQSGLHASFSLSANGESLLLVRPNLSIVDQVVFGAQDEDVSLSRCPNGVGSFLKTPPSFDAENTQACFTGTADAGDAVDLRIFPNPATGQVAVEFSAGRPVPVVLTTALGQVVRQETGFQRVVFDVSGLSFGLYFVMVEGQGVGKVMVAE